MFFYFTVWLFDSFQTMKGRIAGLTPIPEETCPGVENLDLSKLIASVSLSHVHFVLIFSCLLPITLRGSSLEPERKSLNYNLCQSVLFLSSSIYSYPHLLIYLLSFSLSYPIFLFLCFTFSSSLFFIFEYLLFSYLYPQHLDYCTNIKEILETLDLTSPQGKDSLAGKRNFSRFYFCHCVSYLISYPSILLRCVSVPEKISSRVEAGLITLRESIGVANMLYSVV